LHLKPGAKMKMQQLAKEFVATGLALLEDSVDTPDVEQVRDSVRSFSITVLGGSRGAVPNT
jgi:hypothetical protein